MRLEPKLTPCAGGAALTDGPRTLGGPSGIVLSLIGKHPLSIAMLVLMPCC